jgi:hypothetical protein
MIEPLTIRDRIASIGAYMLGGDPSPADLRAYEVQLAGLLTATNRALTGAQLSYNRRLVALRVECKSAADAKLQAEATDEMADLLEAKGARDSVMELLRTCRSSLRSVSDELRLQR